MKKKMFLLIILFIALFLSNCKKNVKQEDTMKKSTDKKKTEQVEKAEVTEIPESKTATAKKVEVKTVEKAAPKPKQKNTNVSLTFLFTNNTNGSLEPCGCPGNKFGGMAQRMTYIKEEREKDPDLLLLDAGDFFSSAPNIYHPDPVIEIMNRMKYDVVTIGDQEMTNGVDYFLKKVPNMKFDLVSANMTFKDSGKKLVEHSYVIKEVKGVKIGIIGVFHEKIFTFFDKEKVENIKVLDPVEIVRPLIKKLHREADITIVLSHQGFSYDKMFADGLYWIDFLIGAHDGTLLDNMANRTNDIPIFQMGKNGERLGKITVEFDTVKRKIIKANAGSIFVDKNKDKDPETWNYIQDYEKNVPTFTDTMGKTKFLGTNYCRKCHLDEFKKWTQTGHYNALMTIKKQRSLMHPNQCYTCHATNMDTNDIYGIECETCHRIKKSHDTTRIKVDIDAQLCLKCHIKEKSPDFDFEKYKERIKHW